MAYLPNKTDDMTSVLMSIDYPHHEIHGGSMYSISIYDADLDTDDELTIAFTTDDSLKWMHAIPLVSNSSASLFEILESPTITVDSGSQQVAVNNNRNSSNTSLISSIETTPTIGSATINPTITADGTVIYSEIIGFGRGGGASSTRGVGEKILKQNTTYAYRLTGLADNGAASLAVVWYEHTSPS